MEENEIVSRVYTVQDIMVMLQVSKSTVYKLLQDAPFNVIRIGDTYRVLRGDFEKWLTQK